jgi:hypothetical protein
MCGNPWRCRICRTFDPTKHDLRCSMWTDSSLEREKIEKENQNQEERLTHLNDILIVTQHARKS